MKRYLKPLYNSRLGVSARNIIGFRPPKYNLNNEQSYLASDLFFWRTDQGFSTTFKASDIIKKFYDQGSCIELIFFNQHGTELFKKTLQFNNDIVEITIDRDLMGTEAVGTFCALNKLMEPPRDEIKATNRCYVGYGKNGSYSMVHGNLKALYTTQLSYQSAPHAIQLKPAISAKKGSYTYYLQKSNTDFFKNNLIFTNPLDRNINITIFNETYRIGAKCCKIITPGKNKEVIEIQSDFIFPRPLVFSENGSFIDVHHG